MVELRDSQIWESERCIIQIQAMGKSTFDFRGIIFEKKRDGTLNFVNILFNEKNRLIDFIKSLKMQEVKKRIITRKRDDNDKR